MFDSYALLFLLFDGLLGLGCIFFVVHYLFKKQEESKLPADSPETAALRLECLRLRAQLQQQSDQLKEVLQKATFQQLQTLLTNYPSVRQIAQVKPDLPAKNLISLFTPLDSLLESWGYATIGSVWKQELYNSQLHQPDSPDISEGELVYVRFVGYQHGNHILCPAKVSRTLPGGVKLQTQMHADERR